MDNFDKAAWELAEALDDGAPIRGADGSMVARLLRDVAALVNAASESQADEQSAARLTAALAALRGSTPSPTRESLARPIIEAVAAAREVPAKTPGFHSGSWGELAANERDAATVLAFFGLDDMTRSALLPNLANLADLVAAVVTACDDERRKMTSRDPKLQARAIVAGVLVAGGALKKKSDLWEAEATAQRRAARKVRPTHAKVSAR